MILAQVIIRESEDEPAITVVVNEIGTRNAYERSIANQLIAAIREAGRAATGEPVRVADCIKS